MSIPVVHPQQTPPAPAPEGHPTTQLLMRDRYIDSLRALALIMIMTYHVFGWTWLPMFPSMGIMFALAGSLVASSLDRSPSNPWRVLKQRSIRLLLPVWLFGLVVVPIMLLAGWTHSATAGAPLNWRTLLFWIVPISDPPGSEFGYDWVDPLWFIRAFLWFLLLSPALLWLFRRWPKWLLAIPVTVVLLSALGLPLNGRSGDVILTVAMFGGCWMLGFAHQDEKIQSMPLDEVLLDGVSLMALGLTWAFTHPDPVSAFNIGNIPMANTFYSLGAVLILLRLHPDLAWMEKRVVLDKLVTVINSRAMTIYLWGNLAIFLSNLILDRWSVTANLDQANALGSFQMYLTSWLIVIAAVFMFGWCEDLAARRSLRINPWPRSQQQVAIMRTRKVLTFPRAAWSADLTPTRLFIVTSGLLAVACGVSAAALSGTNTPGRTATADAPSRYAVNARPDTRPPANLGQGNGQKFQFTEGLEKIKGAVLGTGNGIRPAITGAAPTKGSHVLAPGAAGLSTALLTTTTAPVPSVGVLAPVPPTTPAPTTPAPTKTPVPTTPAPTKTPVPTTPVPTTPPPDPTTTPPPDPTTTPPPDPTTTPTTAAQQTAKTAADAAALTAANAAEAARVTAANAAAAAALTASNAAAAAALTASNAAAAAALTASNAAAAAWAVAHPNG